MVVPKLSKSTLRAKKDACNKTFIKVGHFFWLVAKVFALLRQLLVNLYVQIINNISYLVHRLFPQKLHMEQKAVFL